MTESSAAPAEQGDGDRIVPIPDAPDAVSDPDVDDVRSADDPTGADDAVETQYGLRSGLGEPDAPTADDPASHLNP